MKEDASKDILSFVVERNCFIMSPEAMLSSYKPLLRVNLRLDIAFLMLLEGGLLNNSLVLAEIGLCSLGLEAFRVWDQATTSNHRDTS